jgi:ABC-type sugar transport system permease subunit
MKSVELSPEQAQESPGERTTTLGGIGLRLLGLMIFSAFGLVFIYRLLADGYWPLAIMIGIITVSIVWIFLREDAYPLRWMAPGLVFMLLISVYPIAYTIYLSFTNFGTGHLLPKVQVIDVLEQRRFLPETASAYEYAAYQNPETGEYALWAINEAGESFFLTREETIPAAEVTAGELDDEGFPATANGYARLTVAQLVPIIDAIGQLTFGGEERAIQITGQLGRAAELQPRFVYDPEQDAILDQQTGRLYVADDSVGFFVAEDGEQLIPGYTVPVGLANFTRFLSNPSFRGPLVLIFVWTFIFALFSVVIAFSLGLLFAIIFGRGMPGQRLIKSLLLIPFAVPNVITILVWRGLLNPLNGVISTTLADVFNQPVGWPPVFSDPYWVKVALIVINVWLAYPYWLLVNSGALQAIPTDMYEAADIDGANVWQQFRNLTLPMLLVGVGPLLIASFTANFNSFNVIYLFNSGGPPMVGTSTPAGHSDILISYVYRLAFASGGGQDFGYASAITIIIFFVLVLFTLYQFRYMRIVEEVGENV